MLETVYNDCEVATAVSSICEIIANQNLTTAVSIARKSKSGHPVFNLIADRISTGPVPDGIKAQQHIELGLAMRAAGERSKAADEFLNAFAWSLPDRMQLIHYGGQLLMDGSTRAALIIFECLASYDSPNLSVLLHLAACRRLLGDFEGARSAAARAQKVAPRDPTPLLDEALSCRFAGDLNAARVLIAQAASLIDGPEAGISVDILRTTLNGGGFIAPGLLEKFSETLRFFPDRKDLHDLINVCAAQPLADAAWLSLSNRSVRLQERDVKKLEALPHETLERLFYEQTRYLKIVKAEPGWPSTDNARAILEATSLDSFYGAARHDRLSPLQAGAKRILSEGRLTMTSPYGGAITAQSSVVLDYSRLPGSRSAGSCIAYMFDEDPIIAFFLTEDFWCVAWYDPVSNLILRHPEPRGDGFDHLLRNLVAELKLVSVANYTVLSTYLERKLDRNPAVHVGCVDYISTHAFSELGGLSVLIREQLIPSTAYVAAKEVFGKVEDIFPELSDCTIVRPDAATSISYNRTLWDNNIFAVRISGQKVDQNLSDRLIRLATNSIVADEKAEIDALVASCFPVIFIALRAHNRRWTADADKIADIFNNLKTAFPRIGLILDGHGQTSDPLPDALMAEEEGMLAAITGALNPDLPHFGTAGKPLAVSVYAASLSDCYLSSQGTTATKPVLIANKPGVLVGPCRFPWDVLACRENPAHAEELWKASVETEPGSLTSDFILPPAEVEAALRRVIQGLPLRATGRPRLNGGYKD